ncbi:hypothetical protein [Kitasatospora sp. MY 5-36]|uniref:hypothetical protein n=1 Tax=Kitasatospora sp. MY 5-36 TaxID=1678027 RepID=UPI0006710347|nr:hypothetical protein [Kitasatospora sp. MY 5-36]
MSTYLASADALLSYVVEPEPDPLTVSTDKDPVSGRLDITVTRGEAGPAYCEKLTVRIRIGAGAEALTEKRSEIVSSVLGGSDPGEGGSWTARPGFADGDWQVFEFTPARPPQFTDWRLTLVVSQIEVNKTPGNADIQIIEKTSPTSSGYTDKTTPSTVAKFPAEFVFRNFRPEKVMVDNGEHATLKWDGSDAEYTMFWDRNSRDVSSDRTWTTPDPLVAPTGFMLQAKVTTGGDTLIHTLTTVVMVEKPDLEVGNLNVYGEAATHGALATHGVLAVNGELELQGISSVFGHHKYQLMAHVQEMEAVVPTDGILSIRTMGTTGGNANVSLFVKYWPNVPGDSRTFAVPNPTPVTLPLTKGSTIKVEKHRVGSDVIVDWFPFGGEPLPWPRVP